MQRGDGNLFSLARATLRARARVVGAAGSSMVMAMCGDESAPMKFGDELGKHRRSIRERKESGDDDNC